MLTLYDYPPSRNAYRMRLLLSHLILPYETKLVSISEGGGHTSESCRVRQPHHGSADDLSTRRRYHLLNTCCCAHDKRLTGNRGINRT
jgi:hypothetical protein